MQIYNQFKYFMSRDILIQHQNTKFKKLNILTNSHNHGSYNVQIC